MIAKVALLSLAATKAKAAGDMGFTGPYQELHKETPDTGTCGNLKDVYKANSCCGNPSKMTSLQVIPQGQAGTGVKIAADNTCAGAKPQSGFDNFACMKEGLEEAAEGVNEQSGAVVTAGYQGSMSTDAVPITSTYFQAGLCPVNVHWHLGTEHYSAGEYDEKGTGPDDLIHNQRRLSDAPKTRPAPGQRRLGNRARLGFRCNHYDAADSRFTTPYNWQHCMDMQVGETYEIHWPHSMAGACNTPNQYQSPFYDGVFCNMGTMGAAGLLPAGTAQWIGVQGQVFTLINDENYYYPDLFKGMIVDGDFGMDVAKYTGSTTGTSRNNTICSAYTPITWQVDRKCHLISASSFDKMCADMRAQRDDMSGDTVPHGSRELVADILAADNHHRRTLRL